MIASKSAAAATGERLIDSSIFYTHLVGDVTRRKNDEDKKMSNAITMGIFWHLIGAASAACFTLVQKKKKMVMGNHVVSWWDCFVDYPAVGHQRPVTAEFLGVLQLV